MGWRLFISRLQSSSCPRNSSGANVPSCSAPAPPATLYSRISCVHGGHMRLQDKCRHGPRVLSDQERRCVCISHSTLPIVWVVILPEHALAALVCLDRLGARGCELMQACW